MGTYECERLKTVWKDTHQIRIVAASRDVKKDWGCDSFFKREGKKRKNWANRPNLSTVNSGWREYRRTRSWQSLVHGPVIRVLKFHQNRATRTLRYCRRLLLIYRGRRKGLQQSLHGLRRLIYSLDLYRTSLLTSAVCFRLCTFQHLTFPPNLRPLK